MTTLSLLAPRLALATALATAAFACESAASAQVHWDASAQVGVAKRFLTESLDQPSFGPAVTVNGHVALIPLIRVGAYLAHDISPISDGPARRLYAAGLRGKVQAPWSTDRVHGWGFLGLGYVGVYAPSTRATVVAPPVGPLSTTSGPLDLSVPGASGYFLEVPVGLGLGVRLRRPWELVFELTGRFGFASGGEVYEGRPGNSEAAGEQTLAPLGKDTFALVLTGGIGLDL
jgi:hypothetical protein